MIHFLPGLLETVKMLYPLSINPRTRLRKTLKTLNRENKKAEEEPQRWHPYS